MKITLARFAVFIAALTLVVGLAGLVGARVAAQQGKLSDAELKTLATAAKTPQEHARLVAHYNAHAVEHEAEARLHETLGTQYAKTSPELAGEARHYAAHSAEAAEALRNLAKLHEAMSKGGR